MRAWLLGSLSLCAVAATALAADEDTLVVPSVRVRFEVPRGWVALSSKDVVESRQRVRLSDPAIERYLKERARIPKLIFTKHPSDFPSLNPTLQVYTAASGGSSPEQIAAAGLLGMSSLAGFQILEPPHRIVIRGRRAAVVRVTYPMTAAGASETAKVDARMIVVVDGVEAAVFGLSGRMDGDDRIDEVYRRLVASLRPVE